MSQNYNRLKHEKSPYLLQHQENPVHWYSWGPEAFEAAKRENKPIFLSIGYSTCHWCHVMAHESFEDQEIAKFLNENFISIKVDREERPDVDEIYMNAVHAMQQRGGWPLSMFLTADLKPFFGGTYWPKPHFLNLLEQLAKLWREDPQKIKSQGDSLLEFLRDRQDVEMREAPLDAEVFRSFFRNSLVNFDRKWGGFGGAPKFPHATQLSMLLRIHRRSGHEDALQMAVHTLEMMARGGMYDHLGGGFARYSTDAGWLIPHFEKMLYDNGLLAVNYLEAFQVTKITMFEQVVRETLDYVLRVMTHPEGGFYSAEDADSEGVEGKFYVWTYEELKKNLSPEEFDHFSKVYNVTPQGNFEHTTNNLNLSTDFGWDEKEAPLLKSAQEKLFRIREARVHPHKDDKIITSWNGLMIRAMALAGQVLGDEKYLQAAHRAAHFIKANLYPDKKLLARYRSGEGRFAARLDDYAFLIQGLIDLYQCDFDPKVLQWALELQKIQNETFWDQEKGGYFFTDGQDPNLLVRSKEGMDGAIPNGNGISALNLLRLYNLTFETKFSEFAKKIFQVFSRMMEEYPTAFSSMVIAFDYFDDASKEVAIVANPSDGLKEKFLFKLREDFLPNLVLSIAETASTFPKLLEGKKPLNGKTTFYICQNQTCQAPTHEVDQALQNCHGFTSLSLS